MTTDKLELLSKGMCPKCSSFLEFDKDGLFYYCHDTKCDYKISESNYDYYILLLIKVNEPYPYPTYEENVKHINDNDYYNKKYITNDKREQPQI